MHKKSKTCIATTKMLATSSQAIAPTPIDKEDISEILQEVQKCNFFVSLPQEKIAMIFLNKFKSINLYQLRHMQGIQSDMYKEKDYIQLKKGLLRFKKTSRLLKDYGFFVQEVWQKTFHNYLMIMTFFFGKKNPQLNVKINNFYDTINQLSKVYEWQEAVFLLAI